MNTEEKMEENQNTESKENNFYLASFFTKNKKPDTEMALKIYEYSLQNFDWFTAERFVLDEEKIKTVKCGGGANFWDEQEWSSDVYNKFSPAIMHEEMLSNGLNPYYSGKIAIVSECVNGETEVILEECVEGDENSGHFMDNNHEYPFCTYYVSSFKSLFPIFKSKQTGAIFNSFYPISIFQLFDVADFDYIDRRVDPSKEIFVFAEGPALNKNGKRAASVEEIQKFDPDLPPSKVLMGKLSPNEKDSWDNFEFTGFEKQYIRNIRSDN